MRAFNPFSRPFSNIEADDLDCLRQVSEGWYIEYKREVPKASSIAKSVSAFANHYGGWLFYGIEGSRSGDNVADSFPGVPIADLVAIQTRISNSIASNTNPSPHYDMRIIHGPSAKLGLDEDRCIIVLHVPMGSDTPYVHESGRIYRRIGDKSEPAPETDRSVLDMLANRRRKAEKRLKSILSSEPVLSKGESDMTYMSLYFIPDPLGDQQLVSKIELDAFRGVMTSHPVENEPFEMILETSSSISGGFCARQIQRTDPYSFTYSLYHYYDGVTIVHFPLRKGQYEADQIISGLRHYKYFSVLINLLDAANLTHINLIDFNLALSSIYIAYSKHLRLLREGDIQSATYFKGYIGNVWRHIPFVDSNTYIEQLKNDGFPIIQYKSAHFPFGTSLDTLVPLESKPANSHLDYTLRVGVPWANALRAVGLERLIGDGIHEIMYDAAQRASMHHADPDFLEGNSLL